MRCLVATLLLLFLVPVARAEERVSVSIDRGRDEVRLDVRRSDGTKLLAILRRHSIRAPGFRAIEATRAGTHDVPTPSVQTWRGEVTSNEQRPNPL